VLALLPLSMTMLFESEYNASNKTKQIARISRDGINKLKKYVIFSKKKLETISDVLDVANRPLSQLCSWCQVSTAPFEISIVRVQEEVEKEVEMRLPMSTTKVLNRHTQKQ
jgi:hypothetical protein